MLNIALIRIRRGLNLHRHLALVVLLERQNYIGHQTMEEIALFVSQFCIDINSTNLKEKFLGKVF